MKVAMASRQIDFGTPLTSNRRVKTQKLSSELSKECLRASGSIPFVWENIPGRPKQHTTTPTKSHNNNNNNNNNNTTINGKDDGERDRDRARDGDADGGKATNGHRTKPVVQTEVDEHNDEGDREDGSSSGNEAGTMASAETGGGTYRVSMDAPELPGNVEARGFIMDRFLPAAHAMAGNPPRRPLSEAPLQPPNISLPPLIPPPMPPIRCRTNSNIAIACADKNTRRFHIDIEEDNSPAMSVTTCSFLPPRLRSALCVLNSRRSSRRSVKMKKDTCRAHTPKGPRILVDMIHDRGGDLDSTDDEDGIAEQVKATLQERRTHMRDMHRTGSSSISSREQSSLSNPSIPPYSILVGNDETPVNRAAYYSYNYYDARNRFSRPHTPDCSTTTSVSSFRKGGSLFPQKGLQTDCSSEGGGGSFFDATEELSSRFETPRESVDGMEKTSDALNAIIKGKKAQYYHHAYYNSLSNTGHRSRTPSLSDGEISVSAFVSSEAGATTIHDEKVGWPLGISSSFSSDLSIGYRKWLNDNNDDNSNKNNKNNKNKNKDSPVSVLTSPPLPKSPSDSWLWKAMSSRPFNPSPLSSSPSPPTKKQPNAKGNHKQLRHPRFNPEAISNGNLFT